LRSELFIDEGIVFGDEAVILHWEKRTCILQTR
jgi:hypothetical protein